MWSNRWYHKRRITYPMTPHRLDQDFNDIIHTILRQNQVLNHIQKTGLITNTIFDSLIVRRNYFTRALRGRQMSDSLQVVIQVAIHKLCSYLPDTDRCPANGQRDITFEPKVCRIGPQIVQIWNLFRIDFSTFWLAEQTREFFIQIKMSGNLKTIRICPILEQSDTLLAQI